MYEFIEGEIIEKSPAQLVVKAGGIGYLLNISVNTYSKLGAKESGIFFLHHVVREDAELLFGFADREERQIFRLLISVSGVGANTGRLILSSMTPAEVKNAILSGNVVALQSIKGIGAKSAQRIIVDLRDKVGKASETDEFFQSQDNTVKDEALSALVALGFPRKTVEKSLSRVMKGDDLSVEEVVKAALKLM
ncbi:MAG: Holliday junction branch migration protein RuvA [Bacteroidales bacterium]|jgi:Holliday junction DNA helicase RuvA|nr:Holliday junction branch migration protein RuvA [Bacteroidales bacterium]